MFSLYAPLLVSSSSPWEPQVPSSIRQPGDHSSSLLMGSYEPSPPNLFTLMDSKSFGENEELIYEGCFRDDGRIRDLPMLQRRAMHGVRGCRIACKGYKFFGLQAGTECWCGDNQVRRYNRMQDNDCGKPCRGEENLTPKRFCGAPFRNAIYRVQEKVTSPTSLMSLDLNRFMNTYFSGMEKSTVQSVSCANEMDHYCFEMRTMHCLAAHSEFLSDACRRNVETAVPVDCKSELKKLDCNGFEVPKLSCLLNNIDSLASNCRDDVLAAKDLVTDVLNKVKLEWQCPAVYRVRSQGNCCALGGYTLAEECCASIECSSAELDACAEQRCHASGGAWTFLDDEALCCPPAPDESGGFLSIQVIGLILIIICMFMLARSPAFVLGTAVSLEKQGFNHHDYGSLESTKDPNSFDAI